MATNRSSGCGFRSFLIDSSNPRALRLLASSDAAYDYAWEASAESFGFYAW